MVLVMQIVMLIHSKAIMLLVAMSDCLFLDRML